MIDVEDEDEIDEIENGSNETNLSNPLASKKSIGVGYLTFESAKQDGNNPKRGGSNIKNSVQAARSFDYLTSNVKKAFNHLQHAFT